MKQFFTDAFFHHMFVRKWLLILQTRCWLLTKTGESSSLNTSVVALWEYLTAALVRKTFYRFLLSAAFSLFAFLALSCVWLSPPDCLPGAQHGVMMFWSLSSQDGFPGKVLSSWSPVIFWQTLKFWLEKNLSNPSSRRRRAKPARGSRSSTTHLEVPPKQSTSAGLQLRMCNKSTFNERDGAG